MLETIRKWIVESGHEIIEEYPQGHDEFKQGAIILNGASDYYTITPKRGNSFKIETPTTVCNEQASLEETKKLIKAIV